MGPARLAGKQPSEVDSLLRTATALVDNTRQRPSSAPSPGLLHILEEIEDLGEGKLTSALRRKHCGDIAAVEPAVEGCRTHSNEPSGRGRPDRGTEQSFQ